MSGSPWHPQLFAGHNPTSQWMTKTSWNPLITPSNRARQSGKALEANSVSVACDTNFPAQLAHQEIG
jgi:hypothetical protein